MQPSSPLLLPACPPHAGGTQEGLNTVLPSHTGNETTWSRLSTERIIFCLSLCYCSMECCLWLQLICQPSPNLANSTDARTKFANMTRTASLGGQNISGIFASDLTLAQVKTLTVNQSTGTGRDQSYNGRYQVSMSMVPVRSRPRWHVGNERRLPCFQGFLNVACCLQHVLPCLLLLFTCVSFGMLTPKATVVMLLQCVYNLPCMPSLTETAVRLA